MEQKYDAIPTVYKGIQMRSRLEAKIGCFLDLQGIWWDYEPIELRKYIPDYLVNFPHGPTLLECKPALTARDFRRACRRITRAGWHGPALVVGSQLELVADDRPDLVMWGTTSAEDGGWARVGRGRWPAEWGDYPFSEVFDRWIEAGNVTRWQP